MLRAIWDDALARAERERPEVAQQLREFVDAGARIRCEPVDDQGMISVRLGTGQKGSIPLGSFALEAVALAPQG